MNTEKKIEVFSAGCSTCKETIELVRRLLLALRTKS